MSTNSVNTSDQLWTAQDVASYLRASVSFVYKTAAAGRLPCVNVGALVRFHPDAIRKWAEQPVRPNARRAHYGQAS
jgi:excisionase family DNA binding protein